MKAGIIFRFVNVTVVNHSIAVMRTESMQCPLSENQIKMQIKIILFQ